MDASLVASRSSTPPEGRYERRRHDLGCALGAVLSVHAVLAVAQGVSAWATGSVGITASALHVVVGSVAHVIALLGIRLGTRPPDARYPYGYERYEPLASMVIGMLLLLTVGITVTAAAIRLAFPRPSAALTIGAAIMAASAAANGALYVFLNRRARDLESSVLHSEAVHSWADVLVALSVIGGLALGRAGFPRLDPVVALGVAGFVAWRGWNVVQGAAQVLADVAVADVDAIRRVAAAVPGILGCHAVRCRGEAGRVRVDLHVHVQPDLTVARAHEIAREVEARVKREIMGVTEVLVHVGPLGIRPDEGATVIG
jgi:cation diffusion facilitator family transporter